MHNAIAQCLAVLDWAIFCKLANNIMPSKSLAKIFRCTVYVRLPPSPGFVLPPPLKILAVDVCPLSWTKPWARPHKFIFHDHFPDQERAELLIASSFCSFCNQANVLLLDSGVQKGGIPMDQILELPSAVHPSVVPPLATPCSLHGIESISEERGWSSLDLQLVWKHLYHRKVYRSKTQCRCTCLVRAVSFPCPIPRTPTVHTNNSEHVTLKFWKWDLGTELY